MSGPSNRVFRAQRRVEFRDTDMAGIVHFSVFFTYMEAAEHAFLRELGLGVHWEHESHTLSWPRVSASCDYRYPLRFEQMVDITLSVQRLGASSVTYACRFSVGEQEIAEGQFTAVCCVFQHDRAPVPTRIPDDVRTRLAPYLVA